MSEEDTGEVRRQCCNSRGHHRMDAGNHHEWPSGMLLTAHSGDTLRAASVFGLPLSDDKAP